MNKILTLLMNYGFLVFGVTDYVGKLTTLHYGAVTVREPRSADDQAACRKLGRRLAEWTACLVHARPEEHPLRKSAERMMPS
jgi:NAD(P)H dehydrogenase (quinone)